MRLSTKLEISYVGIVVVAISIALFLIIENAERDLKEKIGVDFQSAAVIEAGNIGDYVKSKISAVQYLSRESDLPGGDPEEMNDYLAGSIKGSSDLKDISVADTKGKVVFSSDPALCGKLFPLKENSWDELVKKARRSGNGCLFVSESDPAIPGDLKWLVISTVPEGSKNKIGSFFVGTINMNPLLKPVGKFEEETVAGAKAFLVNNLSTMIITQDGKTQIFSPLIYIQKGSPLAALMKGRESGSVKYKEPKRGAVLAGYAELPEFASGQDETWAVISMAPQKEVFSPAIRLRNKMIVLGFIAVGVAYILALFLAKGITRPIRKLVEVTDMIAGGDLSGRADISQNDEVGDLARSFNKMTEQLSMAIVERDQEIIERKNIEEKLLEEMEEKAKFVSLISYEFRTPLTAIKEGLCIVLNELAGKINERQRAILSLAQKSGENLRRLVNDIIHFHDLETDEVKLHPVEYDINQVLADVKKAMRPLLAEKQGVDLLEKPDKGLPAIRFDKEKILLVLTNIVNVAINSTDKGHVTVETAREGNNAVRVTIRDEGSAIVKEELPRLFSRFEQVGKTADKVAGGSGLGLAISKKIIEKHHGKIWAEQGENGVVFIFVLPIDERRRA